MTANENDWQYIPATQRANALKYLNRGSATITWKPSVTFTFIYGKTVSLNIDGPLNTLNIVILKAGTHGTYLNMN